MRASRTEPKIRKKQILECATSIAEEIGYTQINGEMIAKKLNISYSLVRHHFLTIVLLRRAIIQNAIKKEIPAIVAQALSINDPLTYKISEKLKTKVIQHLSRKK